MHLHGSCDLKFYIATYQKKKNMTRRTSFLNQEFLCHTLKICKVLNEREEQQNNVGKTAVIIRQIFHETLGALVCLLGIKKA